MTQLSYNLAAPVDFAFGSSTPDDPSSWSQTATFVVNDCAFALQDVQLAVYATLALATGGPAIVGFQEVRFTLIGPDGTSVVIFPSDPSTSTPYVVQLGTDATSKLSFIEKRGISYSSFGVPTAPNPYIALSRIYGDGVVANDHIAAFRGKSGALVNGTWTLLMESPICANCGAHRLSLLAASVTLGDTSLVGFSPLAPPAGYVEHVRREGGGVADVLRRDDTTVIPSTGQVWPRPNPPTGGQS